MSNASIAARQNGDYYQDLVFWNYAFQLLLPNPDIAYVKYEVAEASPCDDVVVIYNRRMREEDVSFTYSVDYIQCKFRADSRPISFMDLIDPNCFHNTESFLQRAYKFYKEQDSSDLRIVLVTSSLADSKDPILSKLNGVNSALLIDNLFNVKPRKSVDTILKAVLEHLRITLDELKYFLTRLRFRLGESIEKVKANMRINAKAVGVDAGGASLGEELTSVLRQFNYSKQTDFNAQTIKQICTNCNWFFNSKKIIGVINFNKKDDRANKILSLGDNALNLISFFNDRIIKPEFTWDEVKQTICDFVDLHIKHGERYLFRLSAINSVCFAFGKKLGLKTASISFENREGVFAEEFCETSDTMERITVEEYGDTFQADNAVVSVSFADSIFDDVNEYMKGYFTSYSLLNFYCSEPHVSNNKFWVYISGIVKDIKKWIKKVKPNCVHIFYRGPVEGIFVLGQYAPEWGKCVCYDYNFGAEIREQRYMSGIEY